MWLEPVAETRAQHRRRGAHTAALQHEMPAVEKWFGVAGIEIEPAKARERREDGRGPLPSIATQAGDGKWTRGNEFVGVDSDRVEAQRRVGEIVDGRAAV